MFASLVVAAIMKKTKRIVSTCAYQAAALPI